MLPLNSTPAAKQLDSESVSLTPRSHRLAAALKRSGAVPLKKASEKRKGTTAGRHEANAGNPIQAERQCSTVVRSISLALDPLPSAFCNVLKSTILGFGTMPFGVN